MVKEIRWLLTKEFLIEWRQRSALAGLLLYAVSTVFVCYLSFRILDDIFTWNALFWVMVLFGAINAGARSFIQESHGLQFYYYTVASPQAIILSKIIYNMVLLAAISLVNYMAMSLFLGNPVDDPVSYLLILIPGSTGLSGVITPVSAIASKAGKNTAMMAILSFPLLMPLLITLIKASRFALLGTPPSEYMGYVGILLLLNVIVWVLSFFIISLPFGMIDPWPNGRRMIKQNPIQK